MKEKSVSIFEYESLMNKVVNNTERMIAANSKANLSIAYKSAKGYIDFFGKRKYLTDEMKKDLHMCLQYCAIIDGIKS